MTEMLYNEIYITISGSSFGSDKISHLIFGKSGFNWIPKKTASGTFLVPVSFHVCKELPTSIPAE